MTFSSAILMIFANAKTGMVLARLLFPNGFAMFKNEPVYINGDGETSRDFCYIDNVVKANLLAASTENSEATNQVYNVAMGDRTTLNELFWELHKNLLPKYPHLQNFKLTYREFRAGDVRHSLADVGKAKKLLDYAPQFRIDDGLKIAISWYVQKTI